MGAGRRWRARCPCHGGCPRIGFATCPAICWPASSSPPCSCRSRSVTPRIAGVPVQVGLYAVPLALLAYAALGSSPQLIVGPASTVAIVSGSLVVDITRGDPTRAVEVTAALAMAAGIVLLTVGLLRVGWIAEFLSKPIVTGFVFGLTLTIIVGEVPTLLGIPKPPGDLIGVFVRTIQHLDETDVRTAVVGGLALVVVLGGASPGAAGAVGAGDARARCGVLPAARSGGRGRGDGRRGARWAPAARAPGDPPRTRSGPSPSAACRSHSWRWPRVLPQRACSPPGAATASRPSASSSAWVRPTSRPGCPVASGSPAACRRRRPPRRRAAGARSPASRLPASSWW